MKITNLETTIVSVPYKHRESSTRVQRDGVTDVIVKLTTDDGRVGWGESCSGADAASIENAVQAAAPFLIGRDPWDTDAIYHDYFRLGLWDYRPMTGCFAFAGIDMALWDLCGKACGQPIYRLFGGAMREEVDYFYYLAQGGVDFIQEQCLDGVEKGFACFYIKAGIDVRAETEVLTTIRETIGPERKIRIDINEAWSVAQAVRILLDWNDKVGIDFCEAPVPIDPLESMMEVRRQVPVALCANEGLWKPADAMRVIKSRCADVVCFSSSWVGSLRRFHTLSHTAHLEGQGVCKHTHGELGLTAAAGQHVALSIPNAIDGHQQTAYMMEDDILTEPVPIADGPIWGRIEKPGLGVDVDEEKLALYHEAYLQHGQFLPYSTDSIQGQP
jgi:glucarate dehydratase